MVEKKYSKAKRLVRELEQREADLLQLLQEKDSEYNALVRSLKDRVIRLEQELMDTQRQAGFPIQLPHDKPVTPQLSRRQQQTSIQPLLLQLGAELSDTEISDISPDDGDKTATVERKVNTVAENNYVTSSIWLQFKACAKLVTCYWLTIWIEHKNLCCLLRSFFVFFCFFYEMFRFPWRRNWIELYPSMSFWMCQLQKQKVN